MLISALNVLAVAMVMVMCSSKQIREPNNYGQLFKQANQDFALKLYNTLSSGQSDSNLVMSPFSLSNIMSMVYLGARGKTAHEIRNALGYRGILKSQIGESFQDTLHSFKKNTDCVLVSANSIWPLETFNVSEDYKVRIAQYFEAYEHLFNFSTGLDMINSWVANKTNDMIPQILNELSEDTVMVLVNAIYFKGPWKISFDPNQSLQRDFKGTVTEPTTFMKVKDDFGYHECSAINAKILELPYKGEKISMFFVLPDEETTLEQTETLLTRDKLFRCFKDVQVEEINVSIPKFQASSDFELVEPLRQMGIKRVFDYTANLGGICQSSQLQLSRVVQKATISVSEEGAEASAASAAVFYLRANFGDFSKNFNADRPFIYVIMHKPTDTVLFMGRMTKVA